MWCVTGDILGESEQRDIHRLSGTVATSTGVAFGRTAGQGGPGWYGVQCCTGDGAAHLHCRHLSPAHLTSQVKTNFLLLRLIHVKLCSVVAVCYHDCVCAIVQSCCCRGISLFDFRWVSTSQSHGELQQFPVMLQCFSYTLCVNLLYMPMITRDIMITKFGYFSFEEECYS